MRPVSDTFLRTLRISHPVTTEALLTFPGQTSQTPVPLEGGSVTIDRTAIIRRTGNIQLPWSLREGVTLGLDLRRLPMGGYANLWQGLTYPDGARELCHLGVYRVESVSWRTTDEVATIELADRMAQVRDEQFLAPYVATGQRISQAAVAIVYAVFGDTINYHVLYDPPIMLVDVTYSGSRADAISALAQAIGGDMYFDADGSFVVDGPPGAVVITRNAVLRDDQWQVGLDSTDGLIVGMPVYGLGVFPGARIQTIDSPTQITLIGGWRPPNILAMKNTWLTAGEPYGRTISQVTDLFVGMAVTGWGIPAGTYVTAIQVVPYEGYPTAGTVTFNQPATGTGSPILTFTLPPNQQLTFTSPLGPQVLGDPVWTVDAGADGVMVSGDESLDRTAVYNGVQVQGQAAADQPPLQALVVDADPLSPTRWGGPFGKVARLEQSTAVQSQDQASDAAQVLLDNHLGLTRTLDISHAPNPALEAGDVVTVVFPDGRVENQIIDALSLSLGPTEAQQLTTHSLWTAAEPFDQRIPRPLVQGESVFYGKAAARQLRDARRLVPA